MPIKDIKLKKGMAKNEVNELIHEYLELEDDIYLGVKYRHNWKCKCGNIINNRTWDNIKNRNEVECTYCKDMILYKRYKYEVEKSGEYEYIRSFRKGDTLPNGKKVKKANYIQVKHKYCGNIYEVMATSFIRLGTRCTKCCGSYEKSFAYYIEKELGLNINDVWDFEKNTVDPYMISKRSKNAVWVKCLKHNYHENYKIKCDNYIEGNRCPYCASKKVHEKDSFGQYLKDNNLFHLWSDKNTIDPFSISKSNITKVWMLCEKHEYHNDKGGYTISCANFSRGHRCSYCGSHKTHLYDSFGYRNFDKVMSWHQDNKISPFKVAANAREKFKFKCERCGNVWSSTLGNINIQKSWCPQCSKSKGEITIREWLKVRRIEFIHDKPYFEDLKGINGGLLRPDFILPKYKVWIEYDGDFHYRQVYYGDGHEKTKIHDKIKNDYAKSHKWKLIRIPYWEFDNIESILDKELI